jgi:hypothetical protein
MVASAGFHGFQEWMAAGRVPAHGLSPRRSGRAFLERKVFVGFTVAGRSGGDRRAEGLGDQPPGAPPEDCRGWSGAKDFCGLDLPP